MTKSSSSESNQPQEQEIVLEWGECEKHHGRWPMTRLISGQRRVAPFCPACRLEAEQRELLGRAAIPPRFHSCTFSSFSAVTPEQKRALLACQDYAANFGEKYHKKGVSLVLRGNPGTGKNHLAIALLRQVAKQGFSACLLSVAEYLTRYRASWRNQEEDESDEILKKFGDLDLLVLDEVGRTTGSEWEKNTLFQLIDKRYCLMRPTVLLTNLPAAEIPKFLGEAAYDRLREGGGLLVNFDWESYRKTQNNPA